MHAFQLPLSRLHWNVEPASLELKANEALLVVIVPEGPPSSVVSGAVVSAGGAGVVSTVNERVAGVASVLPAASVARTEKVWAPSGIEV